MFKQLFVVSILALVSTTVRAEEAAFKGESEASAIIVSGNVNTETIGAKTKNTYSITELDLASIFGSYTSTKSVGIQTGKSWDAGIRYERVITKDQFSAFIQHKAEADPYNGVFIQKDSTDLGAKYFITKADSLTWFAELGYRVTSVYTGTKENINYVRGYTEASSKINATSNGKLWFEYLADTKHSDLSMWNAEASYSTALSTLFSLKMAYLVNHKDGMPSGAKADTTKFTTALVASY